ncbi:GFA family protein [Maricaulis sp.]|uniref:GFA family protein n=1 Tax=Maricaulis sp. TaxID=1486257 RepID=UPI003A91EFF1
MATPNTDHEGGCSCGHVRYRILAEPLIVHCCHCRWCQRQTGAAFAVNALFEAEHVELVAGDVLEIVMPSPSGRGQKIARCPKCQVAVWSNYYMGGIKDGIRFLRVGTLDEPDRLPPDVHIFTTSKQPWLTLPSEAHVVDEFYDFATTWSQANQERRNALLATATRDPFEQQL